MDKWWTSLNKWKGNSKEVSNQELNRSQYSLVSSTELTDDTIQLWLGLPEEVKYDPALAQFRRLYEKQEDNIGTKKPSDGKHKRLPLVNSAPHLTNNLQLTAAEMEFIDGANNETEVKTQKYDDDKKGEAVPKIAPTEKKSKISRAKYYTKMTILLSFWTFFTVIFLSYDEKQVVVRNSSITPGTVKDYIIHIPDRELNILLELKGPFIAEQSERKLNWTQIDDYNKMDVWIERWILRHNIGKRINEGDIIDRAISNNWTIIMLDDEDIDFSIGETRSFKLGLTTNDTDSNRTQVYAIRMRATATQPAPFAMSYTLNPIDVSTGVLYAFVLLCVLYILIIFEIINRTMAAVTVSTMSLAALALAGERPSVLEVISWLDVETLLLLFSMMILVAIMAETGIFDFLAVFTFEVTKGKLWPLIFLLCAITASVSTFLDNVTTVLLMSPVTIRLCEVMDLDPVPILMFMAIYSNVGGTATPVGDPPNVIVASNKVVIQAGINFTNFTAHMALGILLVCIQTTLQIKYMFRDSNKLRLQEPRDIQDLRHQISIWRRATESLPNLSKDVHVVRERLERKIRKLNIKLDVLVKETSKRACPKHTFQRTLVELKDKYKIRDKDLLIKSFVAIIFTVTMFFLHSIPELNRVSLGWTALLGALLLLILADREDLEPILHRVEWSTLLFFAALFVCMEALSKLGLILYIGGLMEALILMVDESARLAVALMVILWVSGVISAFIDNIPLTTMMVRVVISIGSNPNLNLPLPPLVWALLFGACLGGNGTLIAASANVVCAGVAEQHGYRFTFGQFFKVGFPVMIGHLIVASGYLLMCHCVFTWH